MDRHAQNCSKCDRVEPLAAVAPTIYERHAPCAKMLALDREEREARDAYLAAGGRLPVGA